MTTTKPSHTEEEYFVRVEAEKLKKLSFEKREKISQEDKEKMKFQHWMHCPKCGMELHSMPYRGVTIDKCFECHGIFLDDGELEKIAGEKNGFFDSILSLFNTTPEET